MKTLLTSAPRPKSVVMAMVLGTALSAGLPCSIKGATSADPQTVTEITRYCQVCWRNARLNPDTWADCTQEVFARLLERVPTSHWSSVFADDALERREFLRAIDAVKKRTQRAKKYAGLPDEFPSIESFGIRRDERENYEIAARTILSDRQQRILRLTCDGWSVPEIANELATSVERISDEKYKAIRKLRRHFGVDAA